MRKGVKWQVCLVLMGGYVKIAGMEKEGDKEPHDIKDGFYSKKPWARIKVALAGPIVNLFFALVLFGVIWAFGGRAKPFREFTRLIGWIDPKSEFYAHGIRPGDEITEYNGEPFQGFKDLIFAAIMNGHPATVEGNKIHYYEETKTPYDYTVQPYQSSHFRSGYTIGVLAPASYLIFEKAANAGSQNLFSHSPMATSGIQDGDQLVWVDGELIFSQEQLFHVLNSGKVLLTVKRGNETFLAKVPRLEMEDLRLTRSEAVELKDWSFEAKLHPQKDTLYFMPYLLESDLTVKKSLFFVNDESKLTHLTHLSPSSPLDHHLFPGDQILAVDGAPVHSGPELIETLQNRQVQMIVKRGAERPLISWKEEDRAFEQETNWDDIASVASSIGTNEPLQAKGHFHLLKPVTPVAMKNFPFPSAIKAKFDQELKKSAAQIEKMSDPEERELALDQLQSYQDRLMLGIQLQDRSVIYNPSPFILFGNVFKEITNSLVALVAGPLSPKKLDFGGPLFIIQVMKQSWAVGAKEALFWLGAISLNLGLLNLLPIPVLDGGHICFSLYEKIRGKPLKAKTMQRLIIPFVILLVFLFLYLTYNDLTRIFGRFF